MSDLENAYVRVTNGQTRQGVVITDTVFKLLGHLGKDGLGMYITVDGTGHEGLRNGKARVYLDSPTDYVMLDSKTGKAEVAANAEDPDADNRSDDEISKDLKETFEILAEMTEAVASGVVKGLVISGPPGIGKSHTVETTLDETIGVACRLRSEDAKFDVYKGKLSPIMLYCALYRYREQGSVVVLDDADGILYDEDSLNLLKAALDTKKTRRIHWGTASKVLEAEGVPSSFEFEGGVIFLSNIKWDQTRSQRIGNHLEAISSRAHYLDLKIDTLREKIIHIVNIVTSTDMLAEYDFSEEEITEVMNWVIGNVKKLNKVDLRTVLKAADLKKAMKNNWMKRAERSLCRAA